MAPGRKGPKSPPEAPPRSSFSKAAGGIPGLPSTASNAAGKSQRSLPSVLGRKRKSDMQEEMDYFFLPSDSLDLERMLEEDLQNEDFSENVSPASLTLQPFGHNHQSSSRVPLSTLQSNQNCRKQSVVMNTSEFQNSKFNVPLPKFSLTQVSKCLSTSTSKLVPPATKKLKLRQSWSQFREFIQSSAQTAGRSLTPFPSLKWADRQEMWDLICKKESGMYLRKTGHEILSRHPSLQPRMRTILLDWLIEVCEVYRQHRETFYLAVDFIDRYLSATKDMPKNRLQLIGVTSLFIGSKIEEIYPPKLSEFAYVTDGACSEEEILTMELVILKELNWGLAPMTPNAWMKMYMQISNCDKRPNNESFVIPQFSGLPFSRIMQLLDLATLDMGSLSYSYSVLATAAMCHMQNREVALAVSGYKWAKVADCVSWMSAFVLALREDTPLQPKSFHSVALENQHNIQSHTVELSMLDRAQDILLTKSRESPEPSITICNLVEMTPPETDSDVRFAASKTLVTMQQQGQPSSIFLSPQSPNVLRESKMTFPNISLK